MARRAELGPVADVRIAPTAAPASDLQTKGRETEEHPPYMGVGGLPVHLPAKVRVDTAPLRRGLSAGLRAWRQTGLGGAGFPTSRRFPVHRGASAFDGGRFSTPLRGSPGFTPGSLLRR